MKRCIFVLLAVAFLVTAVSAAKLPDTVKVYDTKWSCTKGTGGYMWIRASGKIKNVSNITYSGIVLEFSVFDEHGEKVQIVQQAPIKNLAPGDVANFISTPPINAYCYPRTGVRHTFRLDKIILVEETDE